jgi:O-antigen biosynthesis protein
MPHAFDERLIIDKHKRRHIIYDEHIVRYEFVAPLAKGKTVLDIACGSGYGTKVLALAGAQKAIGMDIDETAVAYAQSNYNHPNIEFRAGSATKTGVEDKSIDFISSFETIEHITDQETYLEEMCRILKDDGLVFVSTPNREVYKEKNPFHVKEFSLDEFKEILGKYFKSTRIIEQKNAIATSLQAGEEIGKVILSNPGKVMYFLAICSKKEVNLDILELQPVTSLNPQALTDLYENPGMKIVNSLYTILIKIPGVKKLFEKIK